jgi:5-oxopent-3-ene-1,2,5-tricarboxylate decarboxylase/2-hydroxyhepta-2,4-diene-1,7-dioate isomerase
MIGPDTPPPPTKVIAVHLNYRGRAEQRGRVPDVPSYFLKPPSSIARDGDPVVRPRGVELLAFEGEIALIVGERTRHVTPEAAVGRIGWVAPANDLGAYDLRWADRGSNLLSKGQDGFTPIGAAVPAGDVDLDALVLRTRVNGRVVQEDTSANLIFPFGLLIADLSRFVTLEPGDVILTGTPAGSRPLQPGDLVEVEIDGVGRVCNRVVEATAGIAPFGAQPAVSPAARAEALGTAAPRPVVLSEGARSALGEVSTATLTAQLTRRGIRNTFIQGVRPTRPELRMLGYALTLRYVPLREDVRAAAGTAPNAQRRAVESIGPDEVLVIDARQDPGAGTIGDILATRALMRGAAGIVTDGSLRDSAALARLDMPIYYQASHAAALGLLHHPLEINVPVACGGVLVMPGDVVVGDADGALVVPAALAEEVARDALEQEEREAWALERVLAGEPTAGVFPLSDARRPEFEAWRAARRRSG